MATTDVVHANVNGNALAEQEEWIANRQTALEQAGTVTRVENEADLNHAGEIQTRIGKLVKELEAKRMDITRPLDEVKKQIMNAEKEMVKLLSAEHDRIKQLNNAYATKKMLEAEAERKRVDELNRKAQAEEAEKQSKAQVEADEKAAKASEIFGVGAVTACAPVAPVVPPPVQPKFVPLTQAPHSSSNRITYEWKFEIADQNAVPRDLCTVDEKKIRAFLAYQKSMGADIETLQVAGLRLYKEASVGSR